jgi:hypothetical protein
MVRPDGRRDGSHHTAANGPCRRRSRCAVAVSLSCARDGRREVVAAAAAAAAAAVVAGRSRTLTSCRLPTERARTCDLRRRRRAMPCVDDATPKSGRPPTPRPSSFDATNRRMRIVSFLDAIGNGARCRAARAEYVGGTLTVDRLVRPTHRSQSYTRFTCCACRNVSLARNARNLSAGRWQLSNQSSSFCRCS